MSRMTAGRAACCARMLRLPQRPRQVAGGAGAGFKHAALQVSSLRVLLENAIPRCTPFDLMILALSNGCLLHATLCKVRYINILDQIEKCMPPKAELCDRSHFSEALDMCAGPQSAEL